MAQTRAHLAINSFTAGELSPEFDGRTDHDRYFKGCRTLRNTVIRPVGGAKRRSGTRFVAAAKATDKAPLLMDYTPRAGTSYVGEWGEAGGAGYLRFFTRNGQIQSGPNLLTNGTFTTDLASWILAQIAPGTVTWSGGRMLLQTLAGGTAVARQSAVVVAGTPYVVGFTIDSPGLTRVQLGSTAGGAELLNVLLPAGAYVYAITSSTTVLSVQFTAPAAGLAYVDNVSVVIVGAYELASPYLAADLPKLRWAVSADVIYLACEGYAPRKLVRASDTSWTLTPAIFRPTPTEEKDTILTGTITLSATTGTGVTVTESVANFLASDVGRQITSGFGRGVITVFTDTTHVTMDVLDDFASVGPIASGAWVLKGSPNSSVTPTVAGPVGAQVTVTGAAGTFRAGDVGKYIHVQGGVVQVTVFNGGTAASVTGIILHKLTAVTATTNWTLEVPSWDTTDGFPTDVGFMSGDRLVWLRQDRYWQSVVGDYENYSEGTLDDDGFSDRLRSSEVCSARWILGATELFIGTSTAEFVLTGGNDNAMTPLNRKITSDTTYGAAPGRAVRVGLAALFIDRSARGLREFLPDYFTQRFIAQDLLQVAQHLTPVGKTLLGLAYQRAPDSIVWAWRSDGTLLGLTYNAPEKVIGWHRHDSEDGAAAFVSAAVIPHPNGDRDQVWFAVRRMVNGAVVHHIEFLDDTSIFTDRNGLTYGAAGTDASLTYNGPATATVTGLSHLEGKSVVAIADGAPAGTFTVVAGAITLPKVASLIEVGLPFRSTVVTMRPEIPINGTSQGLPKTLGPTTVRLYHSLGATVQGDKLPFRTPEDPYGQPPALFDGDKEVNPLGWDTDGFITIEQTDPLPFEVLAVFSVIGVGG